MAANSAQPELDQQQIYEREGITYIAILINVATNRKASKKAFRGHTDVSRTPGTTDLRDR